MKTYVVLSFSILANKINNKIIIIFMYLFNNITQLFYVNISRAFLFNTGKKN